MTEDQAKAKFCPLAPSRGELWAVAPSVTGAGTGTAVAARQLNCMASECMMWRWEPAKERVARVRQEGGNIEQAMGYCGLAGKTEA